MKFEALPSPLLESALVQALNAGQHSVILTLVDGEVLIGDLQYYHDSSDDSWHPYNLSHQPESLLPVQLMFNDSKGQVFGDAHFMQVYPDYISGFAPLGWTQESQSNKSLKNIPNPMATLIANHNLRVAEKHGIEVWGYIEKSLPQSAVPPDGIRFKQDELIFADWDYLSRIGGSKYVIGINLGVLTGEWTKERSLHTDAIKKLKVGNIERFRQWQKRDSPSGEYRIAGYVYVPESEVTTVLEGQECIVILCVEQQDGLLEQGFLPVILKPDSMRYPMEFLPFIASPLVFYGEVKQIPIQVGILDSSIALVARVIGHVYGQEE